MYVLNSKVCYVKSIHSAISKSRTSLLTTSYITHKFQVCSSSVTWPEVCGCNALCTYHKAWWKPDKCQYLSFERPLWVYVCKWKRLSSNIDVLKLVILTLSRILIAIERPQQNIIFYFALQNGISTTFKSATHFKRIEFEII